MTSKRDRGDELAADSVHTLRHVKRLQVQVEKDIGEKKLTPKELGYEDVSHREAIAALLQISGPIAFFQVFQVAEMTSTDVADVIEKIGLKAMNQIMSGKGISFSLPNRTGAPRNATTETIPSHCFPPPFTGNHQYIPQLDANFLELKHMVCPLKLFTDFPFRLLQPPSLHPLMDRNALCRCAPSTTKAKSRKLQLWRESRSAFTSCVSRFAVPRPPPDKHPQLTKVSLRAST